MFLPRDSITVVIFSTVGEPGVFTTLTLAQGPLESPELFTLNSNSVVAEVALFTLTVLHKAITLLALSISSEAEVEAKALLKPFPFKLSHRRAHSSPLLAA